MGLRTQLEGIVPLLGALTEGLERVGEAASFLPVGGGTTGTLVAGGLATTSAPDGDGVRTTSDPITPDDQYVKPFGADGPLVLLSVLQSEGVETSLDVGRASFLVWLYRGLIYPRRTGARRVSGRGSGGGGGGGGGGRSGPRNPFNPAQALDRGRDFRRGDGTIIREGDSGGGGGLGRAGAASTVSPGEAAIVGAVDRLRRSVEAPGNDAGYRLRGEL